MELFHVIHFDILNTLILHVLIVFISWTSELVRICQEELEKHKDQIEEEEERIQEEDAGKVGCHYLPRTIDTENIRGGYQR